MNNVSIFYRLDEQSIQKRIDAKKVVWNGKHWEFFDGLMHKFSSEGINSTVYFEKETFPIEETLSDFIKKIKLFVARN